MICILFNDSVIILHNLEDKRDLRNSNSLTLLSQLCDHLDTSTGVLILQNLYQNLISERVSR